MTSSSVKNILSKRFSTYRLSHHNDMFIVNGKSNCCNNTFYWRLVYIAASKEYLKIYIILCS